MINLLAEAAATDSGWVIWVILGVFVVIMILTTIIPQRKRNKKMQNLMEGLKVGTYIKTIGGLIGQIKQIDNTKNQIVIDVGSMGQSTLMVIDKVAVYSTFDPNAPIQTDPKKEAPKKEEKKDGVVTADDLAEDSKAKKFNNPFKKKKGYTSVSDDAQSESNNENIQIEKDDNENKI